MFSSIINDSVKSYLQTWIISHPHVIKYPIANDYSTVNFNDGNGGTKTELRQKVLIQVSVRELHVGILKEYATAFSTAYYKK